MLMSNKYKAIGTLGNITHVRTQNTWIIVFPDGTESKFINMRLAMMGAKAALSQGIKVKVYEETLMRFKKSGNVDDNSFRIDITERIKLMMSIESKFGGQ